MVKDKCLYVYINTEFGNDFLDMTPKAQATKEKTDNLDIIKIKNFFSIKGYYQRVKRQPTEWEKIFANDLPGR